MNRFVKLFFSNFLSIMIRSIRLNTDRSYLLQRRQPTHGT